MRNIVLNIGLNVGNEEPKFQEKKTVAAVILKFASAKPLYRIVNGQPYTHNLPNGDKIWVNHKAQQFLEKQNTSFTPIKQNDF